MNISNEVIEVLKQTKIRGLEVFLPKALDRKLYVKVNDVLKIIGGKWNSAKEAHIFTEDPNEPIADCIAVGEIVDPKKQFQFFETPKEIVLRMLALARLENHHSILEPSAGRGAIMQQIILSKNYSWLYFCEFDPKNRQFIADNFEDVPIFMGHDFLETGTKCAAMKFDRIIMNPPFKRGHDIQHVMHALRFLKPDGILVAITAPGWTFRNDMQHTAFRLMMNAMKAEVQDLPAGTFKAQGMMIATKLITIKKDKK